MDTVLWLYPPLPTETLKWLSSLPILMQKLFWWWQCSDKYIISLFPHLHIHFPPLSPSLISLVVSVGVKHYVYLLTYNVSQRLNCVFKAPTCRHEGCRSCMGCRPLWSRSGVQAGSRSCSDGCLSKSNKNKISNFRCNGGLEQHAHEPLANKFKDGCRWDSSFYTNIKANLVVKGKASTSFSIRRGCR